MSMLDYPNPLRVSDIAQYYGKSGTWLNKYLCKKGLIYKNDFGEWRSTKFSRENKFSVMINAEINGANRSYLKWTVKGRQYIHKLLKEDGVI